MTKILLFATGLFSLISANSQTVDFNWAAQIGGTNQEIPRSIAVDTKGNTYTTGQFYGTVDFDPGAGTQNLSATGPDLDIFISKLDADGKYAWAKVIGGVLYDLGTSIAVDGAGNVYATGWFRGTVDFNPGSGTYNLTSTGTSQGFNAYILKLNGNGDFIWAKQLAEGNPGVNGNAITVDSKCNVYTTGEFGGKVDFDPGSSTYYLTSLSEVDAFVSKLDSSGKFIWARQFSGTSNERGNAIEVDTAGKVFITGEFMGTVDFDPGSSAYNLTANGMDAFIAKLDISGNFLWAKSFGSTSTDQGFSVDTDTKGNVYTTGLFFGTVDFDPGSGTYPLKSVALNDIFVLKLDSSGNFVWARNIGGNSNDQGNSIKVDRNNNLCIGGTFYETVDFDPGPNTYNVPASKFDAFIMGLDANGNFMWVKPIGGSNLEDEVNSVAVDGKGNVYATGTFKQVADFYTNSLYTRFTASGNSNNADIFVHKMSPEPCMGSGSTRNVTACESYVSPSGRYTWDSSNTYLDTIPNTAGCDSVITVNLTIPVLDLTLTKNSSSLTSNANGATYQWIDCNNGNMPINGKTSKSFSPTANGSYAVIVKISSCSDTSLCNAFTLSGLNDEKSINSSRVYPNPGDGIFNLMLINSKENSIVEVYNSMGELIWKTFVEQEKVTIDLSDHSNGIYIMKIVNKDVTEFYKIIKN